MQIDAPLSHGSSGGPVLNGRAQVVAIVRASETGGQNLNFAVPVSFLSRLMGYVSPIAPTGRSGRAVFQMDPLKAKLESVYRERGLDGLLDWYEKVVEYMAPDEVMDAQKFLRRARANIIKHPEELKGTLDQKKALMERLNRNLKPAHKRRTQSKLELRFAMNYLRVDN